MKIYLKVKPFRQKPGESTCGPASLKIVLDYYGIHASEKELARLAKTTKRLGTGLKGLVKAAKKSGLKTSVKDNSSFLDVERWLKQGVPPIVDWFTRGRKDYSDSEIADGHYSVVCGIDAKHIYLQDPELGGVRKMAKNDFKRVWFDFPGEFIKPSELIVQRLIAAYPR
ncbi:MAG: cysteine peptidase family C39 domain-containing protein [bacterium]|nr:cysteine peptidase family C39 domain-containing protein [bacterium]